MDLNLSTGAQPPGTPRKQELFREQVNGIFLVLSATYGLGFTLPDLTKSPTKRRRAGDRVEDIYWRLNYQHHQRRLLEVLDTFREKAIEISCQWGPRPCSGNHVSMVAGVRPAATPQEKDQLIQLLQDVLQEFRPAAPPAALSASVSRSLVSDAIPLDLGSSRSARKRVPHAPHQPPPKRAKSTSPDADAAPQSIFVTGPATRSATKTPRALSRLSMYSSKASCGVNDPVFSHDANTPFSTQTTNEASSQEQKRLPHRAPSSQGSYEPSSSALQALNQSIAAFPEDPGYPELPPCPGNDSSDWSDSEDDSFPATAVDPMMRKVSQSATEPAKGPAEVLEESLDGLWLHTPLGLSEAPWIIIWEVMRVCSTLGLDPRAMSFSYHQGWNDQNVFWAALATHDQLQSHTLPEACHSAAWAAGVGKQSKASCQQPKPALTFSASLVYSPQKWPLFKLRLKPPRLDLPHRLDRRFGSDRFLELIVPALDSKKNPPSMKALETKMSLIVKEWLVKKSHKFLNRTWAAFFAREEQDKKTKKAGRARANAFETPSEASRGHRLYLFAQDGNGFVSGSGQAASATTGLNRHIKMSRDELAEWLLQVSRNQDQPIMKLSSRFSLGLSRTQPTVVLEKEQIKNRKKDRLSESGNGNVMNDGIGRFSDSLARKIRDHLGLAEVPTGFQGRIGSGKGFWIRDTKGKPKDWIEVYPSQRKWQCDLGDKEHRTVEVLETVGPLKPAHLNTQFLDILEDRAKDKEKMRECIGGLLRQSLKKDIDEQRNAMENPLLFRLWAQENTGSRHREGPVPYVGGLPERSNDQINVLIDAGFEPKRLRFLSELSLKAQRDKCEETKQRMNILIGCSTYAFMVVDFLGVLEENEIHFGFSSSFKDEQTGFCETFVHGMDVLVARSPAHYPSDIQKVKAVFKPELGSLKDVVVFSRKGRTALADKLSGGDYDGDKAWVCWHQDIVTNFENAAVPPIPDLVKEGFLSKQTKTYRDLCQQYGDQASSKFFEQSLLFNMEPAYVGICTSFKENFCYREGSVGSEAAIRLSTLLSNLVDQSKQGIEFSSADWSRFSRSLLGSGPSPPKPAYKFDSYKSAVDFKHIIDYLKFGVLLPTVEKELARLHGVDGGTEPPVHWDPDLAKLASIWVGIKDKHPEVAPIIRQLDTDLEDLYQRWLVQVPDTSFQSKVLGLNSRFLSIQPLEPAGILGEVIRRGCLPGECSVWSLLKASTLFKKFYKKGPFVWWVAGRQLCMLKGCMQANEAHMQVSNDHLPMVVCPDIYAALRADGKYIRSRTSKTGGHAWGIVEDAEESSDIDTDGYLE